MKSSFSTLLLFVGLLLHSCSNTSEPSKPVTDIDALVKTSGVINTSVSEYRNASPPTTSTKVENGKSYNVKSTKYSMAKNLDNNIIPFNPNANTLWAGALVQGNQVAKGILNSIGDNIPRTPIIITVKSGGKLFGTTTIDNPSNANYSKAMDGILKTVTGNTTANMVFSKQEAYSTSQAAMDLGMSASWLVGSASGKFATNNSSSEKNIYIYFKQEYYTASVNAPSKPSDYFGNSVDINDLKANVNSSNPLCYVSSVTYGRLLMAKMKYSGTKSMDEVKAEVSGAFGVAGGKGSYNNNKTVDSSKFDGIILGGSAGGAAKALTGATVKDIVEFITAEANYSVDSPGYPISYTVTNLADNSIVKLGETTDYTVDEYAESADNFQTFKMHIEGFFVINDCEPFGDGDFYWNLNVADNNNKNILSAAVPRTQTVPAGDGRWVNVKKDVEFTVDNKQGSSFRIYGKISESNFSTDIEVPFDKTFSYPYLDADLTSSVVVAGESGYYALKMSRDALCNVNLYFKITKK